MTVAAIDREAPALAEARLGSKWIAKSYIPGLDGIRAIAVLLVMVGHYGFQKIVPGGLGVTIFFFLSGFLITTLLLSEYESKNTINIGNFYGRRFFRLVPELGAFIIITIILAPSLGHTYTWIEVASSVFYFTNYFQLFIAECHSCSYWPHLWSLAVEENFYIIFPFLVILLGAFLGRLLTVLVGVLVFCLLWRCAVLASGAFPMEYTYKASDCRIDSIAYGCVLAILLRRETVMSVWAVRNQLLCVLIGGLVMLVSLMIRGEFFREGPRYSLQGVGIFMIFLALYAGGGMQSTLNVLDTWALRWMGRLSYGAYLWHLMLADLSGHVLVDGRLSYGAYLWHLIPMQMVPLFSGYEAPNQLPMALRIGFAVLMSVATFGLAAGSYFCVFRTTSDLRRQFGSHR